MFGNHPLPNIAHHSFCSYHHHPTRSPHRRLHRFPRDHLHGLSEGVLIANANAHQLCHVTTVRQPPRPPQRDYCPSPPRGMWANDIRHVTTFEKPPRHVTPRRRRPLRAMSLPTTPATSPQQMPHHQDRGIVEDKWE
jgi:hypothetical protein